VVVLFNFWGRSTEQNYGNVAVTNNGETVKSYGERQIADYLSSRNIRYIYEKEARSQGIIFSKHISNPDFYLPDYDVYIEYWGLVYADDRKVREEYVRTMKWKMRQYYDAKIKFISIYPNNLNYLDWIFRKKFEEVTGNRLP
jgi:DNA helicase-4